MGKGVFLHRPDSRYDDRPEEQYQFPSQYLSRASQFVGDWIIYYEPRRGGSGKGYYAIAKVERIVPDPAVERMYLALIEPGSFLPFERPVPFSGLDGLVETGLLNERGAISGRAQAAVRPISIQDFDRILDRGFVEEGAPLPRFSPSELPNVAEHRPEFVFDQARERVSYLSSRLVRDRVFRRLILDAYDCRCAITGLRFINGGGRAEVEAAHIKPVESNGPDSINNGLALSGTVHWMFDRGLISLTDEFDILVSRYVNDPDRVWDLVNDTGKALTPDAAELKPHPAYLKWHRSHCFKH
jgi:putative restriction endonuclease